MVDLHSDASVASDFHGADGEFDGAIYSEGMIRRYLKIFDDRAIFEEPPLTPLPPAVHYFAPDSRLRLKIGNSSQVTQLNLSSLIHSLKTNIPSSIATKTRLSRTIKTTKTKGTVSKVIRHIFWIHSNPRSKNRIGQFNPFIRSDPFQQSFLTRISPPRWSNDAFVTNPTELTLTSDSVSQPDACCSRKENDKLHWSLLRKSC